MFSQQIAQCTTIQYFIDTPLVGLFSENARQIKETNKLKKEHACLKVCRQSAPKGNQCEIQTF